MSSASRRRRRAPKRRVSFTSAGLGIGSFPPEARVEEPIVNVSLLFDGLPPDSDDVAESIVRPLLESHERMASPFDPVSRTFRPPDDDATTRVRPSDLVRTVEIRGDDDEDAAHRAAFEHRRDSLANRADNRLPWWEILVIRNEGAGPSACVLRVHHVVGDGIALLSAFERILLNTDGTPMESPISAGRSKNKDGGTTRRRRRPNPFCAAWSFARATAHVLTLGLTKYDHDTVFSKPNHSKMKHTGRRALLLLPTVSLDVVKGIKDAAGVTVNDVVTTAVSQAIRDHCASRDDLVLKSVPGEKLRCRALLPVGMPRALNDGGLRNVWAMVSCDVGVGVDDVGRRLESVHDRTRRLKATPRALVQLGVQNRLAPRLPLSVGRKTVFDMFSRHSLVLTNVPGPDRTVVFAGKPVRGLQLLFDNLLTQVDVVSYAGDVYGNVVYDADALPGLDETFGKGYARALVDLADRFGANVPAATRERAAT